jgi:hypothetical protein
MRETGVLIALSVDALDLLIHDFTMDESRQLRCDWYDECYLF